MLLKSETFKEFCRDLIRILGSGYTSVKVVKIPQKKLHQRDEILKKIEKSYNIDFTRSQREYNKKKGFCNFLGCAFKDTVIIAHTSGNKRPEIEMSGFNAVNEKNALKVVISDYLEIIAHKDERKKWTLRLSNETYREIKRKFAEAIKDKMKKKFLNLQERVSNLPSYNGFTKQKEELFLFIVDELKKGGLNWNVWLYNSRKK